MTNDTPQPYATHAESARPVGLDELDRLFTPLIKAVGNYLSTSYPETKSPPDVSLARHWGGICASIAHEISFLAQRKSPYPPTINPNEQGTLALEKGPLMFSGLPGFLKSTITDRDPPIPDILGLQMAISPDMVHQLKDYAAALYDVGREQRQERRAHFSVVKSPPLEPLPAPVAPPQGKRFMKAAKVVQSRMQQQPSSASESLDTGANDEKLLAWCRSFHEQFLVPGSNGDPAAGHQLLRMVFERSATQMLLSGDREGAHEIRDFFDGQRSRDFMSHPMRARFDDVFERIPQRLTQPGRDLFHLFSAIEGVSSRHMLTERDKAVLSQSGKILEQAKQSLAPTLPSENHSVSPISEQPPTTRAMQTAERMIRLASESQPGQSR